MTTDEQRQREVERLTALFTDAILHAPIPDVNPNLIRTVESQARSCALAVIAESQAPAEQDEPYDPDWETSPILRPAPSVRPDTTADDEGVRS